MTLMKTHVKDSKGAEKQIAKIMKSLAILNDGYVWEIAETEKKTMVRRNSLFLVKVDEQGTTRLGEYVLRTYDMYDIKILSRSLMNDFPESKIPELEPEPDTHEDFLMMGFYTPTSFTPHVLNAEHMEHILLPKIDFDKVRNRQKVISEALAPVKENYVWSIVECAADWSTKSEFALWLEEVDEEATIRVSWQALTNLTPEVVAKSSQYILGYNPEGAVKLSPIKTLMFQLGMHKPKQVKLNEQATPALGFYANIRTDKKELEA